MTNLPPLYRTYGTLKYETDGYKVYLEVDKELTNYYRSLIPKYYNIVKPSYTPHITLCRTGFEVPTNLNNWKYGEYILFPYRYMPVIREDESFFWLDCFSIHLEHIRRKLGLPVDSRNPPRYTGYRRTFHITIARKTNV